MSTLMERAAWRQTYIDLARAYMRFASSRINEKDRDRDLGMAAAMLRRSCQLRCKAQVRT